MLVITLPLPHKDLSPNGRVYFMAKARATAKARTDARLAAIDAMNRLGWKVAPVWVKAMAKCTFYFNVHRRRDADNLQASCKAYFDGLTDAGVYLDDHGLQHEPVRIVEGWNDAHLEIQIKEILT